MRDPRRSRRIGTALVRHRVAQHTVPSFRQQRWRGSPQAAAKQLLPWLLLGNARYGLRTCTRYTDTRRYMLHSGAPSPALQGTTAQGTAHLEKGMLVLAQSRLRSEVSSPASDKRNWDVSAAAVGNCWGLPGAGQSAAANRYALAAANWAAHRPLQPLISPCSPANGRRIGQIGCVHVRQRRRRDTAEGRGRAQGLREVCGTCGGSTWRCSRARTGYEELPFMPIYSMANSGSISGCWTCAVTQ